MTTQTLAQQAIRRIDIFNHPFVRAVDILPSHGPLDERVNPRYPYLSGSQLSLYRKCSAKYYFKYGKKLREPADSGLVFGSATHTGAHVFLTHKMRDPLGFDSVRALLEAKEVANEYIRRELERDPNLKMKARYKNGPDDTSATLVDGVMHALDLAAEALFPTLIPIALEQGYVLHWKDSNVLPFLGYSDAIIQESFGQGVVDLKTTTSKKTAQDLRLDTALTGYALSNELATGVETRRVTYAVIERKKDPTPALLSGERANNDFHRLYTICNTLTKALRDGIFLPVDASMDCNYCGFGEQCDRLFGQPAAA